MFQFRLAEFFVFNKVENKGFRRIAEETVQEMTDGVPARLLAAYHRVKNKGSANLGCCATQIALALQNHHRGEYRVVRRRWRVSQRLNHLGYRGLSCPPDNLHQAKFGWG